MAEKVIEEGEKAGGVRTDRVSDNTRQSGRAPDVSYPTFSTKK